MAREMTHYNPVVVTAKENWHLAGIERFAKFFELFNPAVVFLDRTGTIKSPVRTKSLFPMPTYRPISKSYEQICDERAIELLTRAENLNIGISAMWSGGIDSTLLLISLIKNATPSQRSKLTVLMSQESITEYPAFYRDHIHGKLKTESSTLFNNLLGGEDIIIGGEHNDQLFGSDVVGRLIIRFGQEIAQKKYSRDTFFTFFNERLNNAETTNFYLDILERLVKASPVPIERNFDFLWWINFSLKWQSVYMRMLARVTKRNADKITAEYLKTRYEHFYSTDDFQLWSMGNPDKKIKDTWATYKWEAKEVIFKYTKDSDYRDNKTKRGSLYYLLLQQETFNFIDSDFRFFRELDPLEYYQPGNDFI